MEIIKRIISMLLYVGNSLSHILYGTQDEMIPYKIVKKFSEENNCRLNFVENGLHWLHTDREVAAMRKWEQTVLEESRSIIPNK